MIVGLLLAAGGARRFGSQKLLAPVAGDTPLVRHTAAALRDAVDALVIVVGSEGAAVTAAFDGLSCTIVPNDAWADGLSGSLRAGIRGLPAPTDAVVIALGDQPFVDPAVTRAIIATWRTTGAPIVSARYAGVRGHPVLFERSMFSELDGVSGDSGARSVVERDPSRVAYVDVDANAPPDVDTTADLALVNEDHNRQRAAAQSTRRGQ